ncbi:MAG: NADH-quinone oxidoreductase subunit NuoE [Pseudomonadota bacterium]
MLRRLHQDQPESFAFTPANQAWAEGQIGKYPEGRQASAIIPLLWRAQEQEGWLSRAAIEHVAGMLGMAPIRALEVATFYFMFQLQPVGRVAHLQVCGTLSCMLCGAEDLVAVCREKIAREPHKLSADGKFSWEEVECLGACANAPMVQIGKDYYEDLDKRSFADLIDRLGAGEVPRPGSYKRRFASEPEGGATSLVGAAEHKANASVEIAAVVGDTVRRIDGTDPAYRVEIIDAVPGLPPPVEVEVTPFDRQPEAKELPKPGWLPAKLSNRCEWHAWQRPSEMNERLCPAPWCSWWHAAQASGSSLAAPSMRLMLDSPPVSDASIATPPPRRFESSEPAGSPCAVRACLGSMSV